MLSSLRDRVDTPLQLPTIATHELKKSEYLLRRAHHVLSFLMHLYIHSLPPDAEIRIPAPITIPLLQVCTQLHLPPTNTYTDNVLYNWAHKSPPTDSGSDLPTLANLRCRTLFTGTRDEEEFYLSSTRIELRGVEALELMRATMDEAFIGDAIAVRRITTYLHTMATVIADLRALLLAVRAGCDPEVFYHDIRPWFNGADSGPAHARRAWVFDGLAAHPELAEPTELSGPSAGQSPLVHALDVFLGVDQYSHASTGSGARVSAGAAGGKAAFLARMQSYMSRHHRNFLRHLAHNPRPLRAFVEKAQDAGLREAYNASVKALKEFRDAHMIIVTLYILGPAKREREAKLAEEERKQLEGAERGAAAGIWKTPLKGTGGTDLVKFLKGVRDRTAGALLPVPEPRP